MWTSLFNSSWGGGVVLQGGVHLPIPFPQKIGPCNRLVAPCSFFGCILFRPPTIEFCRKDVHFRFCNIVIVLCLSGGGPIRNTYAGNVQNTKPYDRPNTGQKIQNVPSTQEYDFATYPQPLIGICF